MGTVFSATIVHQQPRYARQAAQAAFAELERLEGRLSRFIEASDISRINRLKPGQATTVQMDTFDCLQIALRIQEETGGAFDVAYASCGPASSVRFTLDERDHAVRVLAAGVRLDLGGIGKGFALDRMAALLSEWEIGCALLCAGNSTVLGTASPPDLPGWPVIIGTEPDCRRVDLVRGAVSGSGRSVRGHHIIDPRTGRPALRRLRAWATAPTAAVADALSTAFMIMSEREISRYCGLHPEVSARVESDTTPGPVERPGS